MHLQVYATTSHILHFLFFFEGMECHFVAGADVQREGTKEEMSPQPCGLNGVCVIAPSLPFCGMSYALFVSCDLKLMHQTMFDQQHFVMFKISFLVFTASIAQTYAITLF